MTQAYLRSPYQAFRGHVQTIFGKLNVMGGGRVACNANFFCVCIAFILLLIAPRFCCSYANYITRVFLLLS